MYEVNDTGEFIRANEDDEDNEWKNRVPQAMSSADDVQRMVSRNRSVIPMNDDHQTKVLASLVPDEIIYNITDYSHRHYDACLLFGDVSGKPKKKTNKTDNYRKINFSLRRFHGFVREVQ